MRSLRGFVVGAAALAALVVNAVPVQAQTDSLSNLRYRAIGPAISGGRITAVAGSNRNPWLYYAGGADGGVFKTTDGGMSWTATFDDAPVAAIGAIAIDPSNDDSVWVGTGESNPRNTVASGDGIWHSGDGGKTWKHLGLDTTFAISSIAIDPHDPQTIVTGALGNPFGASPDRGVYVTHDGGAHWTKSLYVDAVDGVSSIAMDPSNPRHLFAGVWEYHRWPWFASSGGVRGGVFATYDGGATWTRLRGGGLPAGLTGRIGLSISASNPKRVYAIIQAPKGALWRSDDDGKTWATIDKTEWVGWRGYYFSTIFANPHNSDEVIDPESAIARSEDAGRTWSLIGNVDQYDAHALWWSRDGRRIASGADTGAGFSVDGGKTWYTPRDLPVSQIYHVGLSDSFPYQVCIGLQDALSWCGPGVAQNAVGILNRNWTMIAPGDGMYSLYDPVDQNFVWSTETNRSTGQVYLTDLRTLQAREVSPSQRFSEGMASGDMPYRFDWVAPIAFTYTKPVRTLLGGNVVFATADRGQTWSVVSPDLTRNEKSHQLASGGPIAGDRTGAEFSGAIAALETTPLDPQLIFVGTDDGLVQISKDGGAHWSGITPPNVPPWGRVAIEAGRSAAGTAYVAIDRHMLADTQPYLFKTADFGAHWQSIAGNLPRDRFLKCVREDPFQAGLLFACTQRGVWTSFDGGAHWRQLRLNMPASAVYDVQIEPHTHDLVVGTQGRGVWVLDDLTPLEAIARGDSQTLLAPRDAYRYFLPLPYASSAAGDFVGENAPYGAVLNIDLQRAVPAATLDITDANGATVRRIALRNLHAGINRVVWDLATNGPTLWKYTVASNAGPAEGQQVVPGKFGARLTGPNLDARTTITVRATSGDPAIITKYQQRYAFLSGLYADLSRIDAKLNEIGECLRTSCPQRERDAKMSAALSTEYQTPIQMVMTTPHLRQRVNALIERVGTSDDAPNQAQLDEAATLHQEIEKAME